MALWLNKLYTVTVFGQERIYGYLNSSKMVLHFGVCFFLTTMPKHIFDDFGMN